MSASTGRILEEFTPLHLQGLVITLNFFLQQIAISVCLIVASLGMPGDKDYAEMKTTEFWRIFLGFPLVFCFLNLILIAFFIRHEPPKFYILQGKPFEALASIKMTYHKKENHREILEYLE